MTDATFDSCWFLTGPTASGKTTVGIALARRLGAEILSMDAMALYRGMDIGTAKPTEDERATAPHHLIDLVDPADDFSVAQYVAAARDLVKEIRSRGREVLFVGGTPLYLKALLRGLFDGPAADWDLRRRLGAMARESGPETLHARLTKVDPAAAQRLHPRDERRIIRALEVFELTGRPISEQQREFDRARPANALRVFALEWPRGKLIERIDARVEAMFAGGLVDEARRLQSSARPLGRAALQAVGYQETIDHLTGKRDLVETIELVKTRTRQFAKRQMTWFRSLSECRKTPIDVPFDVEEIAARIEQRGRHPSRVVDTPGEPGR